MNRLEHPHQPQGSSIPLVILDAVRDVVEKLHGLVTFLVVSKAAEYSKTKDPSRRSSRGCPLTILRRCLLLRSHCD